MSFNNIKSKSQAQKGFTIVELLIVVVVIAILAAITIVSYNGITNRANASGAQAAAASVQKKAELFAADGPTGKYPSTINALVTAASDKSYATPISLFPTATNGALTADNGKSSARYYVCATGITAVGNVTPSNVTGARVEYWNYTGSGTLFTDIGATGTPANNCFVAPVS